MAAPEIVAVDLICPSNDCPEVDPTPPGVARHCWQARAIVDPDGALRVIEHRFCSECGTEGEVV